MRRLTALDTAMLGALVLMIALHIVAALLSAGWPTAALTDAIVGGYLLALALNVARRVVLARLMVLGAIAGLLELATDAAGEGFARSLVYAPGGPFIWASPAYMPLSWTIVLTLFGYLAWRLSPYVPLPVAMTICGVWAGLNIPFYEEMAFHAGWWRYAAAPAWGHTPLYVMLFEALIGASLPVLVRGMERASWRGMVLRGAAEGAWMPVAALAAWLLLGR